MTASTMRRRGGGLTRGAAAGEVVPVVAVALLALIGSGLVLKIWDASLDIPFTYTWDAQQFEMYTKTILDHGWYFRNPDLGAPFGQQLYDYPNVTTDDLQAFVIKLLGLFTSNWAAVVNVYFLLTFPLAAVTCYLVFRRLGVGRASGIVCATLFSLLPYHFVRGENHLFYSGYYAVPLGAYLVLSVFAREPLYGRRAGAAGRGPLAYASRQSLLTLAMCIVVTTASGAGYYALFTVLLVAAGILSGLLAGGGRKVLANGAFVIVAIGAFMVVNLSPSFVYAAQHGTNHVAGQRSWKESEFQALKLAELVLPIEHHRVGVLAHLSDKYAAFERTIGQGPGTPLLQRTTEAEAVHLGFVATVGFAFLVVVALALALGARSWALPYRGAAVATVVSFLIGTVGGISILIATAISPQFRSWNRISVFIAFFGLYAIALLLTSLQRRLGTSRGDRAAFAALLVAVLGLGVLDQTSSAYVPPYKATAASFASDGAFVRAIETRLGGRGSIFQLPYMPFPDGGLVNRLTDYDLVRGYLHSTGLRWSFGAMEGRPQDWQAAIADEPLALQIRGAIAAGFDAAYVDRYAFADSGAAIERDLRRITGAKPLRSPDRRLLLFDLRPLRRRLVGSHTRAQMAALKRATLYPVTTDWEAGFGPPTWRSGRLQHATAGTAGLGVVDPTETSRKVSVELVLSSARPTAVPVSVRWPGGATERVRASRSGTRVGRLLDLRPGRNDIRIDAGGNSAPVWVRARVVDSGFRPFGRP